MNEQQWPDIGSRWRSRDRRDQHRIVRISDHGGSHIGYVNDGAEDTPWKRSRRYWTKAKRFQQAFKPVVAKSPASKKEGE